MTGTVVVSQLGARMHYAVPRILHRAGRLERLYTDICVAKGWPRLLTLTPPHTLPPVLRRLRGRVPDGIPADRISCFENVGMSSVLRRMLSPTQETDSSTAIAAGQTFSRAVVRRGFGRAEGFYGISTECLEQLQWAARNDLWTAVEQMIAPRAMVDDLIAAEVERHPEWGEAFQPDRFAAAFAAREKAEWASADIVVCPSEFVRQGVVQAGGPAERCVVVPYGIDARFHLPDRSKHRSGPLRVLTVGAVGLRKGSPYVLKAARRLGKLAEFRLVGPVTLPDHLQATLREALDLAGPTPRAEIARHYAWADVFLLPSVCEGSATVTYEALAAGLPVVTTPNAGSVVRDGVDGFICPASDLDSICEKLLLLARDRDLREAMSEAARTGAADHNLEAYGRRLLAALSPNRPQALRQPATVSA